MSRQGSPLRQQPADGPLIKTNSLELIFSSINDYLLKLTSRVDTVEQVQKSCWRSSEPALCPDASSLEDFAFVPEALLVPPKSSERPGSPGTARKSVQLLPPQSVPNQEFRKSVKNSRRLQELNKLKDKDEEIKAFEAVRQQRLADQEARKSKNLSQPSDQPVGAARESVEGLDVCMREEVLAIVQEQLGKAMQELKLQQQDSRSPQEVASAQAADQAEQAAAAGREAETLKMAAHAAARAARDVVRKSTEQQQKAMTECEALLASAESKVQAAQQLADEAADLLKTAATDAELHHAHKLAEVAAEAVAAALQSQRIAQAKVKSLRKRAEDKEKEALAISEAAKIKAQEDLEAAMKMTEDAAASAAEAAEAAAAAAAQKTEAQTGVAQMGLQHLPKVPGKELVWMSAEEATLFHVMIDDHRKHKLHNATERLRMLECETIAPLKQAVKVLEFQLEEQMQERVAEEAVLEAKISHLSEQIEQLQADSIANIEGDEEARKELKVAFEGINKFGKSVEDLKNRCRRMMKENDDTKTDMLNKMEIFEKLARGGSDKDLELQLKNIRDDIYSESAQFDSRLRSMSLSHEEQLQAIQKQLDAHTHGIEPKMVQLFDKQANNCVRAVDGYQAAVQSLEEKLREAKNNCAKDKKDPSSPASSEKDVMSAILETLTGGGEEVYQTVSPMMLEVAEAARAVEVAGHWCRMELYTVSGGVEAYRKGVIAGVKSTVLVGPNDKTLLNDLVVAEQTLRHQSSRQADLSKKAQGVIKQAAALWDSVTQVASKLPSTVEVIEGRLKNFGSKLDWLCNQHVNGANTDFVTQGEMYELNRKLRELGTESTEALAKVKSDMDVIRRMKQTAPRRPLMRDMVAQTDTAASLLLTPAGKEGEEGESEGLLPMIEELYERQEAHQKCFLAAQAAAKAQLKSQAVQLDELSVAMLESSEVLGATPGVAKFLFADTSDASPHLPKASNQYSSMSARGARDQSPVVYRGGFAMPVLSKTRAPNTNSPLLKRPMTSTTPRRMGASYTPRDTNRAHNSAARTPAAPSSSNPAQRPSTSGVPGQTSGGSSNRPMTTPHGQRRGLRQHQPTTPSIAQGS